MAVTTNAVAMPGADLPRSLVVTVTRDSRSFLDVGQETPAELSENLKAHLAGQPGKRVYFKGDTRTPFSTIVSVLGALQSAGVDALILLTSQDRSNSASYRPPVGLEVLLRSPDAARAVTLGPGDRQASDAQLRQQAGQEMPIVVEADSMTPFGDVVHAVDVLRGEGATVFLAMQVK